MSAARDSKSSQWSHGRRGEQSGGGGLDVTKQLGGDVHVRVDALLALLELWQRVDGGGERRRELFRAFADLGGGNAAIASAATVQVQPQSVER